MSKAKYYYNEDNTEYAILISTGYGTGWSTANERNELAYDCRVIWFWVMHHDPEFCKKLMNPNSYEHFEAQTFFKVCCGYDDVYFGGYENIQMKWIPVGTKIYIDEYDGLECIKKEADIDWICG